MVFSVEHGFVWVFLIVLGYVFLTVTKDAIKLNKSLQEERENIQALLEGIARSFSAAIDYKDNYTGNHSRRVTNISILIANELGLSEKEVFEAYIGALLHDIGKVGMPDHILNKKGPLTEEEYNVIKQHPVIGASILSEITSYEIIRLAANYHHERWDGSMKPPYPAYPGLVKGEEIPQVARIIAVADTYDAMTTDRPYRKGLSSTLAVKLIRNESGRQFDPSVVDCFLIIHQFIELDLLLQENRRKAKKESKLEK